MAARMSSEYWCHQCNHTTVPIIGDDLCCPRCNGGFIEEIEAPPQRHVEPSPVEFMGPRLMALMRGAGLRGQREMPLDEISENQPQRVLVLEQSPLMMQMMQAFSSALAGMHAAGEEQEENSGVVVVDPMGVPMFILQGANGVGAQHVPGAVGDYFMGSGLEMLLQRLAENDPNRYGTPPAAKEAVEAIPAVKITEEHLKSECSSECAVCKEDFTAGEETRQLPCKHLYHAHCIFPWLKMHSSCPVCRFQMPTDDDEESGKGQSEESTSEGERRRDGDNGSGAEGNDSNSNGNSRWFRISVPFSMIGSLVSSALGNGNRNRDNSSNHGGGNGANPSDHS